MMETFAEIEFAGNPTPLTQDLFKKKIIVLHDSQI